MNIRRIFVAVLTALAMLLPTVAFAASHHAPPPSSRRTHQVVRHVPRSAPQHMARSHAGGHYSAPRRYAPPPRRYAPPPRRHYYYRTIPWYYYTPYYYGYSYYPRRYYSGWYRGHYYTMHREDWIALVGLAAFIAAFGG